MWGCGSGEAGYIYTHNKAHTHTTSLLVDRQLIQLRSMLGPVRERFWVWFVMVLEPYTHGQQKHATCSIKTEQKTLLFRIGFVSGVLGGANLSIEEVVKVGGTVQYEGFLKVATNYRDFRIDFVGWKGFYSLASTYTLRIVVDI